MAGGTSLKSLSFILVVVIHRNGISIIRPAFYRKYLSLRQTLSTLLQILSEQPNIAPSVMVRAKSLYIRDIEGNLKIAIY